MKDCPKCSNHLIQIADGSRVCPNCAYYESDSEAFILYPSMFEDLGKKILTRIKRQLATKGLTESEGQIWLEEEPNFNRQIAIPLDDRRKVTPLDNRRRSNSAHIPKTFQLTTGLCTQARRKNAGQAAY